MQPLSTLSVRNQYFSLIESPECDQKILKEEKTLDKYSFRLASICPDEEGTKTQDIHINTCLKEPASAHRIRQTEFIKPKYDSENRLACKIFSYDENYLHNEKVPYLNGSIIQTSFSPYSYIATQAPKENTVRDHFQLMLDSNSKFLVTLVMPKEPKKKKDSDEIELLDRCVPYWETKEDLRDGYQLAPGKTIERIAFDGTKEAITIRELIIHKKESSESKVIHQYHYENWPDQGTPNLKVFAKFLSLTYEQICKDRSNYGPVYAHCHAGSGRTGIYIACCMLMDYIQEQLKLNQSSEDIQINIARLVFEMRLCRIMMIHSPQVHFLYEWLKNLVIEKK